MWDFFFFFWGWGLSFIGRIDKVFLKKINIGLNFWLVYMIWVLYLMYFIEFFNEKMFKSIGFY